MLAKLVGTRDRVDRRISADETGPPADLRQQSKRLVSALQQVRQQLAGAGASSRQAGDRTPAGA